MRILISSLISVGLFLSVPAFAQETSADAQGCEDHGALTRYPGSVLEWCKTDNYLPYKIPVGPLSPVFTNASEGGREKNRRVGVVER